jgi:hypothetical protein
MVLIGDKSVWRACGMNGCGSEFWRGNGGRSALSATRLRALCLLFWLWLWTGIVIIKRLGSSLALRSLGLCNFASFNIETMLRVVNLGGRTFSSFIFSAGTVDCCFSNTKKFLLGVVVL